MYDQCIARWPFLLSKFPQQPISLSNVPKPYLIWKQGIPYLGGPKPDLIWMNVEALTLKSPPQTVRPAHLSLLY